MKIYVSLTMTGQMETVRERCLEAEKQIKERYGNDTEVVFPYDAMKVGTPEQDDTKPLGYWIGKDIELLMECDAVYMCNGWEHSRGCLLENGCAWIYDKQLFYQNEQRN